MDLLETRGQSEAEDWFADDWGNQLGQKNVSFMHAGHFRHHTKRLAIVQSGVYDTWNWAPTIETIVKAHVADGRSLLAQIFPAVQARRQDNSSLRLGWQVDYFGFFQRGIAKRYEGGGKAMQSTRHFIPWNVSVQAFVKDMIDAGGTVRSLRTTRTTDTFIAQRFHKEEGDGWDPVNCAEGAKLRGGEGTKTKQQIERACRSPPHTGQHATELQAAYNRLQVRSRATGLSCVCGSICVLK